LPPAPINQAEIEHWHKDVPGSRWFRADLHVHTLDDFPGGRIKWPNATNGSAGDPATQEAYAHALLRAAIARGVQVLGLTPHSVRTGQTDETSATWRVIETWQFERDQDGVPYRSKIYAVFPGFEPSISDGSKGLHLLFLFDPAIGRSCYVRAFQAIMGGIEPWQGGQLRNSSLDAKSLFRYLARLHREESGRWGYLCLAPHAFGEKGLFSLKSQILQDFPADEICALELGDNELPSELLENPKTSWLDHGLRTHHHALFHGSDAYLIDEAPTVGNLFEVGSRVTLIKLAEASVEALRQAFLASDSRLRTAYCRNEAGELMLRADLPDPLGSDRPWLRSVEVTGGTAFFGGIDPDTKQSRSQTFELSPDLTCVIGGRMTGKSTFLDGLRTAFGHALPEDEGVRKDVLERGRHRFLSGNPSLKYDIAGPLNPTAEEKERWPAEFYTQRELQRAVDDQAGLRKLLFRLVPGRATVLTEREEQIRSLDERLKQGIENVSRKREELGEAEQAFTRAQKAKDALERFAKVGVEELTLAQHDSGVVKTAKSDINSISGGFAAVKDKIDKAKSPECKTPKVRSALENGTSVMPLSAAIAEIQSSADTLQKRLSDLAERLSIAEETAREIERQVREDVQQRLIELGGTSEELNRFDELNKVAAQHQTAKAALDARKVALRNELREFARAELERRKLVGIHRADLERLAASIQQRFGGRIRLKTVLNGIEDHMNEWIRGTRERGITRWWNDHQTAKGEGPIGPEQLLAAFRKKTLSELGVSGQVEKTFREVLTEQGRTTLRALRNEDFHGLELRVSEQPPEYRAMADLSGGAQVSLLLSLLLESEASTPLLIDQPEDELDKAYLLNTVLPALRRLKGRRQVVFATHDANIVVNGDADQVIFLSAVADAGRISGQGTIENPVIRQAILDTLDGGPLAFELRKAKYGF
jgi:hypothetical protein